MAQAVTGTGVACVAGGGLEGHHWSHCGVVTEQLKVATENLFIRHTLDWPQSLMSFL